MKHKLKFRNLKNKKEQDIFTPIYLAVVTRSKALRVLKPLIKWSFVSENRPYGMCDVESNTYLTLHYVMYSIEEFAFTKHRLKKTISKSDTLLPFCVSKSDLRKHQFWIKIHITDETQLMF
jgi:hypothetical protein